MLGVSFSASLPAVHEAHRMPEARGMADALDGLAPPAAWCEAALQQLAAGLNDPAFTPELLVTALWALAAMDARPEQVSSCS